jgi:hypothetical protein
MNKSGNTALIFNLRYIFASTNHRTDTAFDRENRTYSIWLGKKAWNYKINHTAEILNFTRPIVRTGACQIFTKQIIFKNFSKLKTNYFWKFDMHLFEEQDEQNSEFLPDIIPSCFDQCPFA